MQLTPQDMHRAAMACRAAAFQAEKDAGQQTNPCVKAGFEKEAREYAALAERFDAKGSPPKPR